jgi:hypothetical protein
MTSDQDAPRLEASCASKGCKTPAQGYFQGPDGSGAFYCHEHNPLTREAYRAGFREGYRRGTADSVDVVLRRDPDDEAEE